jgi:hypothetical protein
MVQTDYHIEELPDSGGDQNEWGDILNDLLRYYDGQIERRGAKTERPATGDVPAGAKYVVDEGDDEGAVYLEDAGSWVKLPVNVVVYSDDSNAPAKTVYFDSTDEQLEYKDASGTIHSGSGGTDTRTDVSDDGTTVVSETEDIDFGTDLDVTDDGDNTVTVDATGSASSGVEVEDDDTTVVADATTLNFGTDLGATDAGSGQATLNYTGSSQSTSLVGQLSSGNIVGIYEGGNVTTDPSGTTTPVQDTIDALNASSGTGGIIYLPAGVVQENGPLRELYNKRLTGVAASEAASNRGSVIEFTHSGHGLVLDTWSDTNHITLDNLALRPDDSTDGRSAIRLYDANSDGSTTNGRMFNMRNITLKNWVNTADDDGIIGVHEPHLYSCHWDNLFIRRCQGNGIGGSANSMFNFLEISNYLYSPDDDGGAVSQGQSAISTNPGTLTSMQATIGYLNVGRAAKKAIHLHNQTENGRIIVGAWNFEPTELASVSNPVFDIGGKGYFQALTGKVTGTDVESVFELGFNNDNNILGQPRLGNSSVTNSRVYVTGDSNGPSWYFGPKSHVGNDGSVSKVRCLATAGTRNHADSGSVGLEASGSGNNTYNIPIYLRDGGAVDWQWASLSLSDGTTDTSVLLYLVDWNGNNIDSISVASDPNIIDKTNNSPLTTNTGSAQRAYFRVKNESSTNYTASSSAADAVEYATEWVIE